MLNYLWVERRGFQLTLMDQQKCIFMYTYTYIQRGERDGEIFKNCESGFRKCGWLLCFCSFLVDMKSIKIKHPGKHEANMEFSKRG